MREDWEERNLGDLTTIKTGKLNANAMVENGDFPFFTCSREIFNIDIYAFDCEAILLAGNNASGDFNVKHYKGKFNAYQRTYVITINNEEELLYVYLKHKMEANLLNFKNQSLGANTRFLKVGMIKDMPIPIPPLPEQQQIVAILDEAFEAIDQAKANIEKNIENAKELFQSKLNNIFNQKGEGWEEKTLAEVCEIKPPKKLSKEKLNESDLISFVPMKYLEVNQMYFNSGETKTLKQAYSGYVYFEEGDVVLAKITPCFENGKLGIAKDLENGIGFGSSEYIPFRTNKALLINEFLYFFLNRDTFREKGERLMSGAVGHKRIQPNFYEEEFILLPSISIQEEICKEVKQLQLKLDFVENKYFNKLNLLEELKKSILQKAFAGELNNKEVEV